MVKVKAKKSMPFEFVMEELHRLAPYSKPMFGAFGIYVNDKIVFILRDRPESPRDNGIWLATTFEHHASLKKDFPKMRSIEVFGGGETGWQVLPVESEDFEESVFKACRFVLKKDPRIGKVPKSKLSKKPKKKKS